MPFQCLVSARTARWSVASALVALAVPAGPAAADLIVDDFSDILMPSQWPVTMNTVGLTTVEETGLSGVLGGSRISTIFADALAEEGLDDISVTVAATLGKLDYASTVGAEGSLELLYDGSPGRGAPFDLSGESQFEIDFTLFDHSGDMDLPVTITLYDAEEDTIQLTRSLQSPGSQNLVFELDQFSRGGGDGVDLSNIMAISVFFDGALATDFRIEEIRTTIVPAPGALAAMGALVLLGGRRRRCA